MNQRREGLAEFSDLDIFRGHEWTGFANILIATSRRLWWEANKALRGYHFSFFGLHFLKARIGTRRAGLALVAA